MFVHCINWARQRICHIQYKYPCLCKVMIMGHMKCIVTINTWLKLSINPPDIFLLLASSLFILLARPSWHIVVYQQNHPLKATSIVFIRPWMNYALALSLCLPVNFSGFQPFNCLISSPSGILFCFPTAPTSIFFFTSRYTLHVWHI